MSAKEKTSKEEEPQVVQLTKVEQLLQKARATYEPVQLPSRGLVYPKGWTDNKGRISVRRWTVEEEKILSTVRLVKSGKAIDMMLGNCIENKEIDTGELLSGDRSFLLYHLRNISYGANYEFKITCSKCGTEFPTEANLNDIVVSYLEDRFEEPCECTLPVTNVKAEFRLLRGKDEVALLHERSRRAKEFGGNQIDNTLTERYIRQIISLDGITEASAIEQFISLMPAGDSGFLREEMEAQACGVEYTLNVSCTSCGAEMESEVPITSDFFRTSKRETTK